MVLKNELRQKYKKIRDSFKLDEIVYKSNFINKNLSDMDIYIKAKHIMFYISNRNEVETHSLIKSAIKSGKQVYVPKVEIKNKTMNASLLLDFDTELKNGALNILEPFGEFVRISDPKILDIIIIPGIAFDRNGYRIGYGAGYYDKFLTKVRKNAHKIGISYNETILNEDFTPDIYDIPCNYIVTPTGVIDIAN